MMKVLKRIIAAVLIVLMMGWSLPGSMWNPSSACAGTATITKHPIESTATPDEILATAPGKKSNMLLWSLIGVVLVGGIAALAGGGGDGGGGGDDDDGSPTTGTIPVQW
jgi:hypothetical protein